MKKMREGKIDDKNAPKIAACFEGVELRRSLVNLILIFKINIKITRLSLMMHEARLEVH